MIDRHIPLLILAGLFAAASTLAQVGRGWCTHATAERFEGDLNADGQEDALCYDRRTGAMWAALNRDGTLFQEWSKTSTAWCVHEGARLHMADVNGDRRADLICKDRTRIWFDYAGSDFYQGTDAFLNTQWCTHAGSAFVVEDLNADARADLICTDALGKHVDYADAAGRFTGTTDCLETERPCGNPEADHDRDGLPDLWERQNRGFGLHPLRADLILVGVPRPNMRRNSVDSTLDSVVAFFRRVPNTNLDGTMGISVITARGYPLPDIDSDEPGRTPPDYREVRARGLPGAWIGKGHGVLIGSGSGGQTDTPDWSVSANNWRTIVHELGHQLGLSHHPLDADVPSPFYASLMNYDYSYSFRGDPNAIRFSTGRFRSLELDENNLDETLPFPRAELDFLAHAPYRFPLRSLSAFSTSVDFNRNGQFSERGVRANVNSGSSVHLDQSSKLEIANTTGGISLAAFGDLLVSFYADRPGTDYTNYAGTGIAPTDGGALRYRISRGMSVRAERTLLEVAPGDFHALGSGLRLLLVYQTVSGYTVLSLLPLPGDELQVTSRVDVRDAPGANAMLVRAGSTEQVQLLIWDPRSKRVTRRQVDFSTGRMLLGPVLDVGVRAPDAAVDTASLVSNSPVGATWNPLLRRIEVVTTAESRHTDSHGVSFNTAFRMRRNALEAIGSDWAVTSSDWLTEDRADWAGTSSRPTILFDNTPPAGNYLVYFMRDRTFETGLAWTDLVRINMNSRVGTHPEAPFRWTKNLLGNEWVTTRTAPSAVSYRGEVALGIRLNELAKEAYARNLMIVHLTASGTGESGMSDFDDVTFIATKGLRRIKTVSR